MIQQKVTVRSMTENDIADVMKIDRELRGEKRALTYMNPTESPFIGGHLNSSWVAEIDNRIVGFVLCRFIEAVPNDTIRRISIEFIGVYPELQREGVGKAMMVRLVDYCRENNVQQVSFAADPYDLLLQKFLTSLGFIVKERVVYRLNLIDE
jgi:ribosomal protein S18 acetylase RimI-like enzyme